MHLINHLPVVLLSLIFYSCSGKHDYKIVEKDLIPEGTAFDLNSNTIYVSSIFKQKIIGITTGGDVYDVIGKSQFQQFSPLGMEMERSSNTLWVCAAVAPIVNHPENVKNQSAILSFNILTNERLNTYELIEEGPVLLNDLTLDDKGNVYATETIGGKVFKIDRGTNELQLLSELENYNAPNGIVYHQPLNCLFVATNEGILKIPLQNSEITLVKTEAGIDATGIDGLAIYDNYFIGHQSTKVSIFYFNEDVSKINQAEILDSGDEFDSSTTGEVGSGYYHFIVNSQIRSGVNQADKSIKPLDSLENVIVRKIKL